MIEPMKKVTVAYQTAKKKQLVMALRNLGLMHIVDVVQKGEESDRREKDKAAVTNMIRRHISNQVDVVKNIIREQEK